MPRRLPPGLGRRDGSETHPSGNISPRSPRAAPASWDTPGIREAIRRFQAGQEARQALDQAGAAERDRLLGLVREGEEAARCLVEVYRPLVSMVAACYLPTLPPVGLERADLLQAGMLGLLLAAARFDPARGTKFSTYAVWWVRQAMTRTIDQGRPIRLPRALRAQVRQTETRPAGIPPERWEAARAADRLPYLSLEAETETGEILADLLLGPDEDPAAVAAETDRQTGVRRVLTRLLARLPDPEHRVLVLRWGLDGVPARSLQETAELLGLDCREVRRLERAGLRRLRRLGQRWRHLLREVWGFRGDELWDDS